MILLYHRRQHHIKLPTICSAQSSLDEDIGFAFFVSVHRDRLVKKGHTVGKFKGGHNLEAGLLVVDWPVWSLEAGHRGIGI